MENSQAPHEKLTDDEIEELINQLYQKTDDIVQSTIGRCNLLFNTIPCNGAQDENLKENSINLQGMVFSLRNELMKKIQDLDALTTKLKKHTCPEKFHITKVTLGELKSIAELNEKRTEEMNER